MTLIRLKQEGTINQIAVGLTDGTEADFDSGLKQGYINAAMQHLKDVLEDKGASAGLSSVTFIGVYPEFPAGVDEDFSGEMETPIVAMTARLGGMKEIGVGRTFAVSEDGIAKAFNQSITVEFDCTAVNTNAVDRVASGISFLLQKEKFTLIKKGFQNVKTVYSRPAQGWSTDIPLEFTQRWFPHRIARHLLHILTTFDVVWIEQEDPDNSYGTITQIVWKATGDIIFEFKTGMTLDYLLIEDLEFGLHGIIS